MLAVQYCILSFLEVLKNTVVQFMSDSTAMVAYMVNIGGPTPQLTDIAEQIWPTSIQLGISFKINHVAGSSNDWGQTC